MPAAVEGLSHRPTEHVHVSSIYYIKVTHPAPDVVSPPFNTDAEKQTTDFRMEERKLIW